MVKKFHDYGNHNTWMMVVFVLIVEQWLQKKGFSISEIADVKCLFEKK